MGRAGPSGTRGVACGDEPRIRYGFSLCGVSRNRTARIAHVLMRTQQDASMEIAKIPNNRYEPIVRTATRRPRSARPGPPDTRLRTIVAVRHVYRLAS